MQFTTSFFAFVATALLALPNQASGAALGDVQELEARQTRTVAFNVAPAGASCGSGTTIFCTTGSGGSCKGNFNPKQASIVVTQAAGNCHVSLYPQNNQAGGVVERLNTDTTGTATVYSATKGRRDQGIRNGQGGISVKYKNS
ncbi:hypothetical protein CPB83DRAFT_886604 [Crepidotus variabilis]|uniref:Uncharacterized protein n=1 Tax=Crepidotus variabilis TaxID=179855 RepID=A0A9P6E751_9AGAR|nr:hypothetical protein CPB83DRAFT_886604 [Crepidotus variabilis]